MKKFVFVLVLLLLVAGPARAADQEHEMLVRVAAGRAELPALQNAGLYIYGLEDGYIRGAIAPSRVSALAGYDYEVLIPDLVKYHEDIAPGGDFGRYHSYQEIMDSFHIVATNNPNICHLDTIARSTTGKYLIALKITENAQQAVHRPRILWDGTTHGNENIGTEICWYFMQMLVGQYGIDPLITQLVNTRETWLIPVINPEGLINRTRGSTILNDPNRDYGYAWNTASGANVPWFSPEARGQREFMVRNPFVVATTYHSGTRSVMWPWSYTTRATKDSVLHKLLCDRYSFYTGYPSFQISRGLYECQGTSTDFTHGSEGVLGIAPEVANGQPPPAGDIDTIAHANWSGSREFLVRAGWGLRGLITDSLTGQPVKRAYVVPDNAEWMTYADTCGWYFKYVSPGTRSLKVMADGYQTKTITGINLPADTWVQVDVALKPDSTLPITGYKVVTWVCLSPSTAGPTMGFWTLGPRDSRILTLTNRGYAVIEMGQPILNGAGTDFTVYSTTSKPCSVFVSVARDSWNGPWRFLTYASGNIACDLASAGVAQAWYVRLKDGGSSYDLDAIEGTVVNAPALGYQSLRIVDSTGNADGRLDPGEQAQLVLGLRNAGRRSADNVTGLLRCTSPWITIIDSLGTFGSVLPESVRLSDPDRFAVSAASGAPRGTVVDFTCHLTGTGYADSVRFSIEIGEITSVDPIPDGPRTPSRYWAYDDVDAGYPPHPTYQWVEINGLGTRLTLSDDQTSVVSLPSGFGPWRYYGNRYTQISICSNGWVIAGSNTSTVYQNTALPGTGAPANIVALNWDDLYPPTGNGVWWYHDAANHRFIVEYDSVSYYPSGSNYDKFQLIIYDTTVAPASGDNELVAQYKTAGGFASSTVGLQDPSQAIGIQHLYNGTYNRAAASMAAGRAIKYSSVNPTSIEERTAGLRLSDLRLSVFPNPLRSGSRVSFSLPQAGRASLRLYDAAGKLVRTLAEGSFAAGRYVLPIGQARLAGGLYFMRLVTDADRLTTKVTILN